MIHMTTKFIIETDSEDEHRHYLNGPALRAALIVLLEEVRNKPDMTARELIDELLLSVGEYLQ